MLDSAAPGVSMNPPMPLMMKNLPQLDPLGVEVVAVVPAAVPDDLEDRDDEGEADRQRRH
jgi:hypothetical protein